MSASLPTPSSWQLDRVRASRLTTRPCARIRRNIDEAANPCVAAPDPKSSPLACLPKRLSVADVQAAPGDPQLLSNQPTWHTSGILATVFQTTMKKFLPWFQLGLCPKPTRVFASWNMVVMFCKLWLSSSDTLVHLNLMLLGHDYPVFSISPWS